MTRKDFEAVADAIAAEKLLTKLDNTGGALARLDTLFSTTKRMAGVFAQSNSRFNEARFMAACGF